MKSLARILDRYLKRIRNTEAIYIGGFEDPYMLRWHIIPRNKWLNVYHHEFRRPDDDPEMHDHPWWSLSLCLHGSLEEITAKGSRQITPGVWRIRSAQFAHQTMVSNGAVCRTIFITGPKIREWGFLCPKGWKHWKEYTNFENDGSSHLVGRGCD